MIDPALLQAYGETEYRVDAAPPLVLRVGRAHPGLAACYARLGVDCAAFLTACNPFSRRLADAENAVRQACLRQLLAHDGRTWLPGAGRHPDGAWPAEPSVFVPGLAREEASAIGRLFEQNAVVWCGADAVPQLVLLR
jgi:hypothetical protein